VLSRFEPDEQQRLDELLDAAADAVEAWAREGTNKAANRFNMFELRPADDDPAGRARRGRRTAGCRRHPPDADGLAADPAGETGRLTMPERRCAAGGAAIAGSPSASRPTSRPATRRRRPRTRSTSMSREVDAEVADARRRADRPRPGDGAASDRRQRRRGGERGPAGSGEGGQRIPDLSALPALLAATGTLASLRERLGRAGDDRRRSGPHIGLVAVPHGAKTYLAAALSLVADGERLVWIARDAEIGDRVAEELAAWSGDPDAVAVLEPRTSLAYERSELIADETAARVAALAAWRSGRARVLVASVQALLQHTIDPGDLPAEPRQLRSGARLHQDALLHDLFDLGLRAGPRGGRSWRVRAARRDRRRLPAVDAAPDPESSSSGDEIDSSDRSTRPTSGRVAAIDRAVLLPRDRVPAPAGGAGTVRERPGPGGGPSPGAASRPTSTGSSRPPRRRRPPRRGREPRRGRRREP
jgi:hypothetical protein